MKQCLTTYSTFQVSEVHNRGRDTAVPCPYGNRRAIGVYFINVESAVYPNGIPKDDWLNSFGGPFVEDFNGKFVVTQTEF